MSKTLAHLRGGEEESLDLNNFPKEYGKEAFDGSSPSTNDNRFKKKKNGGKDDSYKVYECRFCSLRFCKSQALGGHMNRHRQEREVETLNRARELVFSNECLPGAGIHMSLRDGYGIPHTVPMGDHYQLGGNSSSSTDPYNMQFQSVYPVLSTQSPQTPVLPPCTICPPSHYTQTSSTHAPPRDNFLDSVGKETSLQHKLRRPYATVSSSASYTCFGVPLTNPSQMEGLQAQTMRESAPGSYKDASKWSCSAYGHGCSR